MPNATVTVTSTKARLLGLNPLTQYTVSKYMGCMMSSGRFSSGQRKVLHHSAANEGVSWTID